MKKTIKLALEPARDATFRAYCNEHNLTYSELARKALHRTIAECQSREEVPEQKDCYGKLGEQPMAIVVSKSDVRAIVEFAQRIGIRTERSYSRVMRYAITRACQQIDAMGTFDMA